MNRIMKQFAAVYFWSNKTAKIWAFCTQRTQCNHVSCMWWGLLLFQAGSLQSLREFGGVTWLCETWMAAQHLVTRHPQPLHSHWAQAAVQALISCNPFWCFGNFGSHPARGAIRKLRARQSLQGQCYSMATFRETTHTRFEPSQPTGRHCQGPKVRVEGVWE